MPILFQNGWKYLFLNLCLSLLLKKDSNSFVIYIINLLLLFLFLLFSTWLLYYYFFLNLLRFAFFESRVYRKSSLYLHKLSIRSTYTLVSPDLIMWEYTYYILIKKGSPMHWAPTGSGEGSDHKDLLYTTVSTARPSIFFLLLLYYELIYEVNKFKIIFNIYIYI